MSNEFKTGDPVVCCFDTNRRSIVGATYKDWALIEDADAHVYPALFKHLKPAPPPEPEPCLYCGGRLAIDLSLPRARCGNPRCSWSGSVSVTEHNAAWARLKGGAK